MTYRCLVGLAFAAVAANVHATSSLVAGLHADMRCPVTNVLVNRSWFTELLYGQRIYTADMASGGLSNPAQVGSTLGSLIVRDGAGCSATCAECDGAVLDPITGTKISSAQFSFLCLANGQSVYFASDTTKAAFLDGVASKQYFQVAALTCGDTPCPESIDNTPQKAIKISLRSGDHGGHDRHGAVATGPSEAFCSGSTTMFSGFQTTVHGTCVKLLFQSWVLDSAVKYAVGFIGVFSLPLLNEWLVHTRERLRQSFRQRSKDSPTSLSSKRLNKVTLTALYMAQMTLAYFAMLIVMTYDSGFFVALVAGFGVGYAWFKHDKYTTAVAATGERPSAVSPDDAAALDSPAAPWRFQRMDELVVLHVPGMKCKASCGDTIQHALETLGSVDHVYVEMADKCVYVAPAPTRCNAADLVQAIDKAGFDATVLRAPC